MRSKHCTSGHAERQNATRLALRRVRPSPARISGRKTPPGISVLRAAMRTAMPPPSLLPLGLWEPAPSETQHLRAQAQDRLAPSLDHLRLHRSKRSHRLKTRSGDCMKRLKQKETPTSVPPVGKGNPPLVRPRRNQSKGDLPAWPLPCPQWMTKLGASRQPRRREMRTCALKGLHRRTRLVLRLPLRSCRMRERGRQRAAGSPRRAPSRQQRKRRGSYTSGRKPKLMLHRALLLLHPRAYREAHPVRQLCISLALILLPARSPLQRRRSACSTNEPRPR